VASFIDSGIRFEYTLTSRVAGSQPQPTISDGRSVLLGTGTSVFTGTVKAIAMTSNPALVNGWSAGFIQEIQATCRVGHYVKDVHTEDRLWGVPPTLGGEGKPLRDSKGGDLPYDGNSADLVHGTKVTIESEDDPKFELPLDLLVQSVSRTLTNVTGADHFTIWLAAARDAAPKRLVVLGRIHWKVNWRAVVTSGRNTAMIPLIQPVVHDQPELQIARGFSPGDPVPPGYPQVFKQIEANDFLYRITYLKSTMIRRGKAGRAPGGASVSPTELRRKMESADSWW
jgi:hypothetical protein